jgi:glutamate/aspartate transport system substrate-binding protein
MKAALLIAALLPAAAFAESAGTLDKVRATGQITIGTREASTPFNFIDDDGRYSGLGWDISQRVVERLRLTLDQPGLIIRTFPLNPQTRVALVANHTVDLECSSTTNTPERQRQVSFSTDYFIAGTRLLTHKDSDINDISDLRGKKVVVEAGTTAERLLRSLNSKNATGVNILLSKDTISNFAMLETGRADASLGDDIIFFGNIALAKNPTDWKVAGTPQSIEAYGCMMRKGDAKFKAIVDAVIRDMRNSGEMYTLYNKYFSEKIKVRGGMTLNIPLSSENEPLYPTHNYGAVQ